MKIYTKSGDKGTTSLIGGRRVAKNDPTICAIGEVDELACSLGVLLSHKPNKKTFGLIVEIQKELFLLGAELADPGRKTKKYAINVSDVSFLEDSIDELQAKMPQLNNFILPGGTQFAAHAHLARAICRRVERAIVALKSTNPQIIVYLNRLSDLLFVLARFDNFTHKQHGFY